MNRDKVNEVIGELEAQWRKDFGDKTGLAVKVDIQFDLLFLDGRIVRKEYFDGDEEEGFVDCICIKDLDDKDLSKCIHHLHFLKEKLRAHSESNKYQDMYDKVSYLLSDD